MNCLAWLRLKSSRSAFASPISRMRRFLFHSVLPRERVGMGITGSLPAKVVFTTPCASVRIFSLVRTSRALEPVERPRDFLDGVDDLAMRSLGGAHGAIRELGCASKEVLVRAGGRP